MANLDQVKVQHSHFLKEISIAICDVTASFWTIAGVNRSSFVGECSNVVSDISCHLVAGCGYVVLSPLLICSGRRLMQRDPGSTTITSSTISANKLGWDTATRCFHQRS